MNKPQEESPKYKWYVLTVLTGVYAFEFIDRNLIVICAEAIKNDLNLSDTQLGILTGAAFAILYSILGVPIARLADRSNRKNIISFSITAWSFMTILSGFATSFATMFLSRVGVGIGEAGDTAPSHSLISDYFKPERRATAIAIYSMGVYLGFLLSFIGGGILASLYGWRVVFYLLGGLGVLYGIFMFLMVKEPIRGRYDISIDKLTIPPFKEVWNRLWRARSFRYIAFACAFHAFASFGRSNFMASFYIRIHDLEIKTIGLAIGIGIGLGGMIGAFLGGYLVDKLRARNLRWYFWIPLIAEILGLFAVIPFYFTDNTQFALVLPFFIGITSAAYMGPAFAVSHSLVNARMRAFASSIIILFMNGIGLVFGPLYVGMISDFLAPTMGVESLRWAYAATIPISLTVLYLFYKGSQYYEADLKWNSELS